MKWKICAIWAMTALSTAVTAQMPVPLLESDAVIPTRTQWHSAAPVLRSGLECRQRISSDNPLLRPLFSSGDTGEWTFVPPRNFTVFGMPVQAITIISRGADTRYITTVAMPRAIAVEMVERNTNDQNRIGQLTIGQVFHPSLANIVCQVMF